MTARAGSSTNAIDTLGSIREACPALRLIYLPEDIWPAFKTWHATPDSVALHCSMLVLALDRGHLGRLTGPVHQYLLRDEQVRPGVRTQYLQDLKERWMHYEEALERHRKARIFMGRIAELQVAEWLEADGWKIEGLEALAEGPDIEAQRDSCGVAAFEVKAIGVEDDDFQAILRSIAGEPAGQVVSPYAATNYLLLRIYEAARQLLQFNCRRIVVIVLEAGNWWRFQMQLEQGWIDWVKPAFLTQDEQSLAFIRSQKKRYPDIEAELIGTIHSMEAVYLLKRGSGYSYNLEYNLGFGGA